MGDYTEILIKSDINCPDEIKPIFEHLFNRTDLPDEFELPDHDFFRAPRWTMIGTCSSFYHTPWSTSCYAHDHVFSRSDLKNYGSEIELFFDWAMPYFDQVPGTCVGWSWSEYEANPTLIYKSK